MSETLRFFFRLHAQEAQLPLLCTSTSRVPPRCPLSPARCFHPAFWFGARCCLTLGTKDTLLQEYSLIEQVRLATWDFSF